MLEMAFYWSLFFTQFFDVKRKVGNAIDVGSDEHPGLLGDVHPPRGHPGPPHPQLDHADVQAGREEFVKIFSNRNIDTKVLKS